MAVELSAMAALERALDELIALLGRSGEDFWCRRLARARALVAEDRLAGVSAALATFGGEGTLSDLVLRPTVEDPALALLANRHLARLRTEVFELADRIASGTASAPP
jgi:hypothetical protein